MKTASSHVPERLSHLGSPENTLTLYDFRYPSRVAPVPTTHIRLLIAGRMKISNILIYVGISKQCDSFYGAISRSEQRNGSLLLLLGVWISSLLLGVEQMQKRTCFISTCLCFCAVRHVPSIDLRLLLIVDLNYC